MGIFDAFKKKENDEPASFVLGVEDRFALLNTKDIVVVGYVKGTVRVGAAVYVTNFSDDEEGEILLTTVLGIELEPGKRADEAKDCHVGLKLECAADFPFRCGTVLYSRQASVSDVHDAYVKALGNQMVFHRQIELTQDELDRMSITDGAEMWRLYSWYRCKVLPIATDADRAKDMQKIAKLAEAIVTKMLSVSQIYCVYSKITGEPAMFSETVDQKDGTYMCTPPDIWILTKPYKDVIGATFPAEKYEIREIKNDQSNAISDFFGSIFYMNGACGVRVVNSNTSISAEKIVEKPDFSNLQEINRPVMNPDLERWILLIAELGHPDTPDKELIYKLYFSFMSRELVKAKFLIPMKADNDMPSPDENGKVVIEKDTTIAMATIEGKHGRPAVRMFTDWKRLRQGMKGEGWNGFIQPIEGMIGSFDCAINLTEYDKAGCYIDEEMFRGFH